MIAFVVCLLLQDKVAQFRAADVEFYELRAKIDAANASIAGARALGDKEKLDRLTVELAALRTQVQALQPRLGALFQEALAAAKDAETQSEIYDIAYDGPKLRALTEKLIQTNPAAVVRARHSCALRLSNRYREARETIAPALKANPDDPRLLAEEGIAAYCLDDYAAAVEPLEKAAKKPDGFGTGLRREVDRLARLVRRRIEEWKHEQSLRARDAGAKLPQLKLVTSKGDVLVELFEDDAPNTVASFVSLADAKFFDGTKFHRVIENFMAQGGDPNSRDADPKNDGLGGPGYTLKDEFPEGKVRGHFRGSLSMANAGPHTGGSQFFITHRPTEHLDGKHTVFGRVVSGMDVVDRLGAGDELKSMSVVSKRDHEYKPVTENKK